MAKERTILGIDCGGTNIKMAITDKKGEILHSKLEGIEYKREPEKVIKRMAQRIKKFLHQHRANKVETIGIGIAGDVDQNKGIVRFSPNLGWKNVHLGELLADEFSLPILIENDANCAAWGAYWLDAKRDCKNLVCLTLGTGIGGGIILERKLYRGATGSAGEIGHMTIDFSRRPCKCGNFGCIESLIGAWGLILTAEEGLKKNLAPILKELLLGSKKMKLEPKTLEMAAKQGDPYCQQLWKDAGHQLGCALVNCVNIFNPERIILCGGVSKVGPMIMEPALHTLGQRAFETPVRKVKVSISQYDEKLGVVGAALLFQQ